jgi:hypothetical protein
MHSSQQLLDVKFLNGKHMVKNYLNLVTFIQWTICKYQFEKLFWKKIEKQVRTWNIKAFFLENILQIYLLVVHVEIKSADSEHPHIICVVFHNLSFFLLLKIHTPRYVDKIDFVKTELKLPIVKIPFFRLYVIYHAAALAGEYRVLIKWLFQLRMSKRAATKCSGHRILTPYT